MSSPSLAGTAAMRSGWRVSSMTRRLYWLEDPLVEQDLEGQCAAARGRRRAHLYRREGARGASPGPHRLGGRGRDHGRSGQGRGRHRGVGGSSRWPPPRAGPGTPILVERPNTAASLHMAVAAPNTLIFELKPVPSPMQHELVRRRSSIGMAGCARPTGPGSGSRWTRRSSRDTGSASPTGLDLTDPTRARVVGPSLTRRGGPAIG